MQNRTFPSITATATTVEFQKYRPDGGRPRRLHPKRQRQSHRYIVTGSTDRCAADRQHSGRQNGGRRGLIHCHCDGVSVHERTGMVLGVVGDQTYTVSPSVPIAPGDLLFLHTDGVDEAMLPERVVFGSERLKAVLGEVRQESAETVLARVEAELRRHVGSADLEDDFTMIAVKLL